MSKWEIPSECRNYFEIYQPKVRGYRLRDLMEKTTFKRVDALSLLGVTGMTLHPNNVLLDDSVTNSDNYEFVSCVLAHEMVHVAQQLDWGHVRFMLQYGWEALICLFDYDRMKKIGIEKEAFAFEDQFGMDIGYYRPKMYRASCMGRVKVETAVDLQLKQKFVKRGYYKPAGKTAGAKRR